MKYYEIMNTFLSQSLAFLFLSVIGHFLCSTELQSQHLPAYLMEKPDNTLVDDHDHVQCTPHIQQAATSYIVRRPYDVQNYTLFMDWRNPLSTIETETINRRYSGINAIHIRIDTASLSSVRLDARSLIIDSVIIGSVKTMAQQQQREWNITLDKTYTRDDTLTLYVYYTYIGEEDRGFHAYAKGAPSNISDKNNKPLLNPEGIVYTMNQPENARYWMPCNDAPYDKARASITVRVPRTDGEKIPFSVSSNGLLVSITEGTDTKTGKRYADYKWSDTTLIPTYLMVANASRFSMFRQWYKKVTNPNDSIPIDNYVWEIDLKADTLDNAELNAKHTFGDAPSMLTAYARLFGEYPFVKYGHTVAAPFNFGGMEHQTMTTTNRLWARRWSAVGIAHEIAHQWLGDLVTCATWKDIWLNEGGATWSEALWYESWGGNDLYIQHMNVRREAYIRSGLQPAVWGIPLERIFNYATTYCKAGWVYHMMRKVSGDEKFFASLRSWLNKNRFGSAETADLQAHLEQEIPLDGMTWEQFFSQWLYSPGHPIYSVYATSTPNGNGNFTTSVTLEQNQSGNTIPDVFTMPVTVELRAKNGSGIPIERRTFLNNQRKQTLQFETSFPVTDVIVDPDSSLLAERTNYITSVSEKSDYTIPSILFPNPAKDKVTVSVDNSSPQHYRITAIDTEGREISTIHDGFITEGVFSYTWDTRSIPSGAYTILIRSFNAVKAVSCVVYH